MVSRQVANASICLRPSFAAVDSGTHQRRFATPINRKLIQVEGFIKLIVVGTVGDTTLPMTIQAV